VLLHVLEFLKQSAAVALRSHDKPSVTAGLISVRFTAMPLRARSGHSAMTSKHDSTAKDAILALTFGVYQKNC
jgi:hypothetical protein